MSVNHRKLLHQFKDSIYKFKNNKKIQAMLENDSLKGIQRLSINFTEEFLKYIEQYSVRNINSGAPGQIFVLKYFNKKFPSITPKWDRKLLVSKCAISSQTHHVLLSVESAENEYTLLTRIEALITHLQQYPESRNSAIRAGAIRLLLRIRKRACNNDVQAAIRVALATLGYSDPVVANGIRILSMDGGGIRALLVLEMLKKLEEMTGKRVYELFDIFCGVSTGAILSFILGLHQKSVDEVIKGYKEISLEVFNQSRIWGTGNLVWNQAYYDTSLWEKKLQEHLGTDTLINTNRKANSPKFCVISSVVNQSRLSAFVFRNYSLPWKVKSEYFGSSDHEIWQAARASAAAPTYFEEFKLGNFLHQDGGILVNNPTAVAVHEAKLIWPNTPIQCVISLGTGRTIPASSDLRVFNKTLEDSQSTSWANKFYKILDSATDTEGVHIMLSDLLPDNVYYRFNPYLTELIGMTEINPQKLEQLQRDVLMYLRRNEDKFQEAVKVLNRQKTYLQHIRDYINLNRELYNF